MSTASPGRRVIRLWPSLRLAALALVGYGTARPLVAQGPTDLAAACVTAGGDVALCVPAAVSAYSLTGHTTLVSGSGAPIPGTASNLGTRVGGGPRLAFHARASASSWSLPAPDDLSGEASPLVAGVRVGAAAGLFDGFRLMPTVGGFLATDVFADASFVSPDEDDGFSGGLTSYSLGARVGLFREGFTIPGASISLARRFSGSLDYGDVAGGDATSVTVDPDVTSVRATVSKDLFAVELLGGFGWDDFSGEATVRVSDGAGGSVETTRSLDGSRRSYFASASMTFSLVFTLTLEGGWAEGLATVPGYDGPHDPESGSPFGSVAARLVF